MNNYSKSIISLFILILLITCSSGPQAIEYGKDNCQFCSMTITDNKHASELVTTKGKTYKYDSIECMIRYANINTEKEYSYLLIADYSNPGNLVDAKSSTYLISKKLPSPMGAFLTGFLSEKDAQLILAEKGGNLYNWDGIQVHINK